MKYLVFAPDATVLPTNGVIRNEMALIGGGSKVPVPWPEILKRPANVARQSKCRRLAADSPPDAGYPADSPELVSR